MSESQTKRSPLLLKLGLALLSTVVTLLAVELFNRARLALWHDSYDGQEVRAELRREFENLDQLGADAEDPRKKSLRVLHPYTGFDLLPALRQISGDLAFYGSPEAEDSFEIMILGGSVANGFGRDASKRLIELLQADPRFSGRPMRTLRYARPSFKQPQQQFSLSYLLALGLRPDAVINLDGFNEVAVANHNRKFDAHPIQPSVGQWSPHVTDLLDREDILEALLDLRLTRLRTDALAGRAMESSFLWSSLVGNWHLERVRAGRREQARMQSALLEVMTAEGENPVIQGPRWEGELERVMEYCVDTWSEASLDMQQICERRGIFYMHVLQPTLYAEGTRTPTERELERGDAPAEWMDAVRVGYPMLIARGAELREAGVAFLDATPVFKELERSVYIDACHFDAGGNRLLAVLVSEAFLADCPKD